MICVVRSSCFGLLQRNGVFFCVIYFKVWNFVMKYWPCIGVCVADKLPFSIKILLESAIRNCDEFQVKSKDVEKIIDWENTSPKQVEIPFKPARVLLQVNTLWIVSVGTCHYHNIVKCGLSLWLFIWFTGFYWGACCCWSGLHERCHEQSKGRF